MEKTIGHLPPPDPTYTDFDEDTEPPRGTLRAVADRHDTTIDGARRMMGLDVRERDIRQVGLLVPGTLFFHNCYVCALLTTEDGRFGPGVRSRSKRLCDRHGRTDPGTDESRFHGGRLYLPNETEVDVVIPESAVGALPERINALDGTSHSLTIIKTGEYK